jgi:hypothetical protein
MDSSTPSGSRQHALSLTTIASKLAPTGDHAPGGLQTNESRTKKPTSLSAFLSVMLTNQSTPEGIDSLLPIQLVW